MTTLERLQRATPSARIAVEALRELLAEIGEVHAGLGWREPHPSADAPARSTTEEAH
jgi:hypothetical protein